MNKGAEYHVQIQTLASIIGMKDANEMKMKICEDTLRKLREEDKISEVAYLRGKLFAFFSSYRNSYTGKYMCRRIKTYEDRIKTYKELASEGEKEIQEHIREFVLHMMISSSGKSDEFDKIKKKYFDMIAENLLAESVYDGSY